MVKPTYKDCTDEFGVLDVECYEEACGKYADELRETILEEEWNKPRLTLEEMYHHLFEWMSNAWNKTKVENKMTEDKINRLSNIYAVTHTVDLWRKQFV